METKLCPICLEPLKLSRKHRGYGLCYHCKKKIKLKKKKSVFFSFQKKEKKRYYRRKKSNRLVPFITCGTVAAIALVITGIFIFSPRKSANPDDPSTQIAEDIHKTEQTEIALASAKLAAEDIAELTDTAIPSSGASSEKKSIISKIKETVKKADVPSGTSTKTTEWIQTSKDLEGNYQIAHTTNDTIEIYQFDAITKEKTLFWSGTFSKLKSNSEILSIDSVLSPDLKEAPFLAGFGETLSIKVQNDTLEYSIEFLGTAQVFTFQK